MQEPFSPNDVEPIGSICQMLLAGLDPGDLTLRDVAVLRDNDIRVMGRSGVYWLEFLHSTMLAHKLWWRIDPREQRKILGSFSDK